MTLTKNEEDWIETSVLSIMNAVDEVVVADNGSLDSTPQIMRSLAERWPRRIRYFDFGEMGFVAAVNALMRRTRYSWLLRWHGDFVARTNGPLSIQRLFDRFLGMDPLRHFCVGLSGIALDGDLTHQFSDRRDPPEYFLYTYSPWLHYDQAGRWEQLHVPWFYAKLTEEDAHYFHMRSVKSSVRLLQKWYQGHWFQAQRIHETLSLEEFVLERIEQDLGTRDLREAAMKFTQKYFADVVPYSREICGDLPEILDPAFEAPPYRLVIENGKLVGRLEGSRFRPRDQPGGG